MLRRFAFLVKYLLCFREIFAWAGGASWVEKGRVHPTRDSGGQKKKKRQNAQQ